MGEGSAHQEPCGALHCPGHEMSSGIHAQPPPRVWEGWSGWQFFSGSFLPAKLIDLWSLVKGIAFGLASFQGFWILSCFLSPLIFLFRETQHLHSLQEPKGIEAWVPRGAELINRSPVREYKSVKTVTTVR